MINSNPIDPKENIHQNMILHKILEINNKLDVNPELVNSDPYGDGWMVKIEISDASQVEELLTSSDYETQIGV